MKQFTRWLRSKAGQMTLAGVLVLVLVAAFAGEMVGWWDLIPGLGTAGYQAWGQYRCLPTCDDGITPGDDGSIEPQDGKFFRIANSGMATFAGEKIVLWIGVPADQSSFEVGIFDGDTGKDANGNVVGWKVGGHWDNSTTEATYTLYADPLKNGKGTAQVGQWLGNRDMPDNAWYNITLNVGDNARSPAGHYFYRLEVTQPVEAGGGNAFKVRVKKPAVLSTGKSDLVNASVALYGPLSNMNDVQILYPQFQNYNNFGPSNYDGDWRLYFYLNDEQRTVEFWDGDFDRGTAGTGEDADTADANTPTGTKPEWASQYANVEAAYGKGAPPDDYPTSTFRRTPAVIYAIIDPAGTPVYTNTNPSGTEEWERFVISLDPNVQADLNAPHLKPGKYMWRIVGLDLSNTVFLRTNAEICADGDCLPEWPETACPRTIGYWKNNFNKIFGDGKGNAQETADSLNKALALLGQVSPLYRHGINVQNPQPLPESAGPLTPGEALMILMRKDVKLKDGTQIAYPGGKTQYNSMLARALQQNLAAWLNFTSGKIGKYMYVELTVPGGMFKGSLWDALQEAQSTIFTYGGNMNAPELERAKDIGDQINNGNLGEDAPERNDCAESVYGQKIPKDKQPPKEKDAPKAPKPPKPPKPTPVPAPDPATCEGVRVNTYNVENPTNNPFYGIKFEYQSGTEIKNSADDEFKFTLPADVVNAMTSIQLEAKASTNQVQVTMQDCQFGEGLPCGPVMDDNKSFAFTFMGATDNGDGTKTLTFRVQNFSQYGLSHATFGLPAGAVPTVPTPYQSQVCPGW